MLRISLQIYWFWFKDTIARQFRIFSSLILYILSYFTLRVRQQTRSVMQYQSVRYHIIPLSPLSKLQLCKFFLVVSYLCEVVFPLAWFCVISRSSKTQNYGD